MEMPELNEDILEGAAEEGDEGQNTEELEQNESTDDVVPPQEDGEQPEPQEEEDAQQESAEVLKVEKVEPDEPILPEDEDTNDAKEETDEPPTKKLKSDDELDAVETPEAGDRELAKQVIKDEPEEVPQTGEGTQPDTDMLSTLASAALNQDEKPPAVKPDVPSTPVKDDSTPNKKKEQWHTVGVFETNTTTVVDYLVNAVNADDPVDLSSINLGGRRLQLDPGTAYKLRVCAINSCGAGPWSEVAAFKTTLPGFPGAPSAIKISKSADGAHLTWEPPGGNSGEILEYAVYLAVRSASQGSQPVTTNQTQLAFVRVFCGPTNKCVVGPNSLQAAHIDTTTKPAIIFRIAARNAKGYGPATQVRWLQESANAPVAGTPTAGKRVAAKV